MTKILTVGRIRTQNLGDLLLARGLARLLQDRGFVVEQREFATPKSRLMRTLSKILLKFGLFRMASSLLIVENLGVFFARNNLALIIVGGGQLLLPRPQFIVACRAWVALARLARVPIVAFGVGTECIRQGPSFRRSDLAAFNAIYVRDNESRNALAKQYGVAANLTPDVAYGLRFETCSAFQRRRAVCAGICIASRRSVLGYAEFVSFEGFCEEIVSAVSTVRPQKVLLFSTVKNDYLDSCAVQSALSARFPMLEIDIICVRSIEELRSLYDRLDVVLGARLHSLIFAQIRGVEALPLMRNKKLISYYDTFFKLGYWQQRKLLNIRLTEVVENNSRKV